MRLLRVAFVAFPLLIQSARPAWTQNTDTTATKLAAAAALSWLASVDQGDYEASWERAAPAFQQAVTRADWVTAVSAARVPFEPFGTRTLIKAEYHESLPNAPPGPYVIVQYRTEVSQGRRVIETVVPMRTADGRWLVSGYFVRPES